MQTFPSMYNTDNPSPNDSMILPVVKPLYANSEQTVKKQQMMKRQHTIEKQERDRQLIIKHDSTRKRQKSSQRRDQNVPNEVYEEPADLMNSNPYAQPYDSQVQKNRYDYQETALDPIKKQKKKKRPKQTDDTNNTETNTRRQHMGYNHSYITEGNGVVEEYGNDTGLYNSS